MKKPVTLRRSKTDGRTLRTLISYDVCHDGIVLARLQQDNNSDKWFWYGLRGVGGNTAANMREFEVVKAEIVGRCKDFVKASALPSTGRGTEA